jgi:class 3 adenylate cyclase
MATSMVDSCAFTQASNELNAKVGRELGLIAAGDSSADKLPDDAAATRGTRLTVTGTAADALSLTPQREKFASESMTEWVRGNTRRTANALAPSKRQPSDAGSQPTVTTKDDASLFAAETVHAAVLFADMRGYVALAEHMSPARVVFLLDEFFTILARVTATFGGQVFHIAGDGMMAGFGVRDPRGSGVRAALAAGHAMIQSFAPVAARWRGEFAVVTGIGIGVHSGEVAMGSLGPPGREIITMIGDTANVAAHLCDRARAGEVLFSCAVAAALGTDDDDLGTAAKAFLQLPQFELRGRSELPDVWSVSAPERLESQYCFGCELWTAAPAPVGKGVDRSAEGAKYEYRSSDA